MQRSCLVTLQVDIHPMVGDRDNRAGPITRFTVALLELRSPLPGGDSAVPHDIAKQQDVNPSLTGLCHCRLAINRGNTHASEEFPAVRLHAH